MVTDDGAAGGPVVRVRAWPPPRGPRGEGGGWRWSLLRRPADSYKDGSEARAVEAFRHIATTLVAARTARGWSLRQLAQASGVALSHLTAIEQGGSWPTFDRLAQTARTLGLRVQLGGPGLAGRRRGWSAWHQAIENRYGSLTISADGQLYEIATPVRAWRTLVVQELEARMGMAGLSRNELARQVGLRPNTVGDLFGADGLVNTVSVRTVLAVAGRLGCTLEVVPRPADARGTPERTG